MIKNGNDEVKKEGRANGEVGHGDEAEAAVVDHGHHWHVQPLHARAPVAHEALQLVPTLPIARL